MIHFISNDKFKQSNKRLKLKLSNAANIFGFNIGDAEIASPPLFNVEKEKLPLLYFELLYIISHSILNDTV